MHPDSVNCASRSNRTSDLNSPSSLDGASQHDAVCSAPTGRSDHRGVVALAAAAATLALWGPTSWAALPAPTAAQHDAFVGSPEDPPAEELLGIKGYEGRHYLAGDEWNGDLWIPHISGLGGGYVGVGADQAYLFIGWARPDFAWLIDYDVMVVHLHGVHRAFFLEASDPEAYIRLWSKAKEGGDALKRHARDEAELKRLEEIYRRARRTVAGRLRMLRNNLRKKKVAAYLTDATMYTYVRDLILAGRLRAMSANLLATKGMRGIGDAARAMGVPIRLLYLSNAEQYWRYKADFRQNIQALPFDDKGIVIRTLSTFSINKDYRYVVQPGKVFQDFLAAPWMTGVHQMIPRRKLEGPEDIELLVYTRTRAEVEAKRQARQARRARKGGKANKAE